MPRNTSTDHQAYSITVAAAAIVLQANLQSARTRRSRTQPRNPPTATSADFEVRELQRDADFWYSDGNVVVRAETLLFKLHRSRLSKYCAYFENLFAVNTDSASTRDGVVDGCPVYRLPTNISARAFKQFLIALEQPLAFVKEKPSETDAYIMLDTSHALSCPVTFGLAKDRLGQVWDPSIIPSEGTEFNYKYTAPMISFFRDCGIPKFLKRVYYEVLTDPEFWRTLSRSRRHAPKISNSDLNILYEARHSLQRLWREFVIVPPRTSKDGLSGCAHPGSIYAPHLSTTRCRHFTSVQRSHFWLAFVIQNGQLEAGAEDPVRYNMIKAWRSVLAAEWCDGCLNEWENTWLEKRKEWWIMLDQLFKL